ncbi:MAG: QsdR family transcriptional regulator [Jatrophihabitantaceae bacterium]
MQQRPVPEDAFRLARTRLMDGRRLDMQALATELGINRVTLYRWVGSREKLIVEVLWLLTERTIMQTWAELEPVPGPRVPETLRRWVRFTVDAPGMRRLLHGESEFAMRLLTLRAGGFQPRLLALIKQLVEADIADGRASTPLPIDELAFTVVRICESYLYLPAITGEPADPDMLGRVLGVLVPAAAPR